MTYAKWVALVVLSLTVLAGCSHTGEHRHAHYVRDGMLKIGIGQQAFLDVWGQPERTSVVQSAEQITAKWGGGGGNFFKGSKALEMWSYNKSEIELLFDGSKLIAWKTNKTTQELKSIAKPRTTVE